MKLVYIVVYSAKISGEHEIHNECNIYYSLETAQHHLALDYKKAREEDFDYATNDQLVTNYGGMGWSISDNDKTITETLTSQYVKTK